LNYHISRFVLGSLCVGDVVRMGLSRLQPATQTLLKPIRILISETCQVHKK